jgi:signal transduction histidine kinase
VLDVPVRRGAEVHGILTVTAPRPFTDVDAALLAAIADVLAPLLVADAASDAVAAGRAVLDEEADRAQVAATLLDGVGEALVSVRYAAEMVGAGRVEPAALDEPVRAALAAVRHAHRDLRAHALEAGLRSALRELSERRAGDRPDDGMSELRLLVDADDPQLDAISPPVAVTVQRVAEAALRGASGQAVIRAFCADQRVKLFVESAEIAYDASELNRWARRVHALGGDLRLRPDGVELSLPAGLWPQGSTAQHEGRHDDGTDL